MNVRATDIFRFEVREELKPVNPMYGNTRLIYSEDDLKDAETAITKAQAYQKAHPDALVSAIANQYTSEANVKRHFTLQSHTLWSDWFDDEQLAIIRKRYDFLF